MTNEWIPLTKCTQVKAGDSVRSGLDPNQQPFTDLTVLTTRKKRIGFNDGNIVLCKRLIFEHYWIRVK
jgi:hypothetical protein